MTYRRMLKVGLQQASIDTLVGSPPLPAGLPDAEKPASAGSFWSAFALPAPQQPGRRGRKSADDAKRRAA